uniref:Cytosolic beta-glucosidase n=1 Tax=Ornithorhynchus anatinus TaxID=9258 RepID=F7EC27_ORNAN
GFSWGVGSSAYQTEGAWDQDGKGPSIWDIFTHKGKSFRNQTADSSCESYYKFKDDIQLLRDLGVSHYRFSISWPRIVPTGVRSDGVNEPGIAFYGALLDSLLQSHVSPVATLYHWDLPQALQEKYGGWQNASMVSHFDDYANLCFEEFGDRVKHWITFHNPWASAVGGYDTGQHAPGLRLRGTGSYKAAHHIIKVRGTATRGHPTPSALWGRGKRGKVGISLTCAWGEPVDDTNPRDVDAAERFMDFCLGWFANPIFAGDYPEAMKENVGQKSAEQGLARSRLPLFSAQEKSYIKGSADFLGLGHFTTRFITDKIQPSRRGPSYHNDRDLAELADPDGPQATPWGFRRLLNFAQIQYGNPDIYVTENGVPESLQCAQLCDEGRIRFLRDHVNEVLKAINDGVNVKGYTFWSLLDGFEWEKGYADRYGLYYVEFKDKRKPRYPKASVQYYKEIIGANGFPSPREVENWQTAATETCSTSNQLQAADPSVSPVQMMTEVVVPTVCALCILISAVFFSVLLRRPSGPEPA